MTLNDKAQNNKPIDDTIIDDTIEETLIEFPCAFPIKVMGETHVDFSAQMIQAIQTVVPEFDTSKVEMRASSGGKYISLTCTVDVTSKPQLDAIYRTLTSHPMVKFAL